MPKLTCLIRMISQVLLHKIHMIFQFGLLSGHKEDNTLASHDSECRCEEINPISCDQDMNLEPGIIQ